MIIYKATNLINNKIYIGKTIRTLDDRRKAHIIESHNSKVYFHDAIRKYGENSFSWEVLTEADSESKLNVLEKFYIACYRKMGVLYNLTDGGDGLSGYKHTEESKKKIGEAAKKVIKTDETRKKLSIANKGKKPWCAGKTGIFSEEMLKKLSDIKKGKTHTAEAREKMSKARKGKIPWNKGIPQTEEMKNRISNSLKGRYCGEKNPFYGKKHSEETKLKMKKNRCSNEPVIEI
jgi:group I intron endonuclease